jgi:hypothetical protein
MPLHIITADERLKARSKVNIALFGPSGVGKTFQARTLDPATTLFVDLEAGMKALDGDPDNGVAAWAGDSVKIREEAAKMGVHPWEFARALVCLLGGPDPSAEPGSPYSREMFAVYEANIAPQAAFAKYQTIFVDSITVASRLCFSWSKRQPQAMSEKTGKPDNRGAYGLLGQEMVTWLTQAQHIADKSIIVVGILNVTKDDFGRPVYEPQIEGGKTGQELPGIFDNVVTIGLFDVSSGAPVLDLQKGMERGFVCHQNNGFGVPAKDRSGRLAAIEAPDLGALMRKIQSGPRADTANFAAPQAPTPDTAPAPS